MMIHHEGTKDTKVHEAPHPQFVCGCGGGASCTFVSFVPSW